MTDVITVTSLPTFRELNGRFARATPALLDAKREGMRGLGRQWIEIAREEAPRRTGTFIKSLIYRTFETGDTVGFNTYSAQPLGSYIVLGTRAHLISAHGRALYFLWENWPNGKGWYAFAHVHHPGTKPNPYHERATERWKPDAEIELHRISLRYIMTLQGK